MNKKGNGQIANLTFFDSQKKIQDRFDSNADLVLYQGDVIDFLGTVPDNSVSLIITSPPYNLGKDYEDRVSIERYLERQTETIAQLYSVA
jgi:adenine-specific DNA-methyltransferase